MKKLLATLGSSVIGVVACVGFVYLSQALGLSAKFPSPGGEDDFSFRALYFFFGVCPAFLVLGAWIGYSSFSNTLKWLLMWAGVVIGSILVIIIVNLLRTQIETLTQDGTANQAVIIFYASWVAMAILGAFVASRLR